MVAEQRRQAILEKLQKAQQPVSASVLATQFSVSRQVIVGDIALLRASGADISATPRGYVISASPTGLVHRIACRHDAAGMETELNIIVDNGCTVLDVIVEHPVYGQLTGSLQLASRYDVQQFIRRSESADAVPLSALTEGIHLHTVSCPDAAALERICTALQEQNLLLEN